MVPNGIATAVDRMSDDGRRQVLSKLGLQRYEALADRIMDVMLFRLRDEAAMPCDALEFGNRLAEFHSVSRPAARLSLKKPNSLALISIRCGGQPNVQATKARDLQQTRRGPEVHSATIAARKGGYEMGPVPSIQLLL